MKVEKYLMIGAIVALLLWFCSDISTDPKEGGIILNGTSQENLLYENAEKYLKYAYLSDFIYDYKQSDFDDSVDACKEYKCTVYYDKKVDLRALVMESNENVIIVFRGTDSSRNWLSNGSNLVTGTSNIHAASLVLYDEIKKLNPNKPFILSGHSLGGGLGFYVATQRNNTKVIAFNTSRLESSTLEINQLKKVIDKLDNNQSNNVGPSVVIQSEGDLPLAIGLRKTLQIPAHFFVLSNSALPRTEEYTTHAIKQIIYQLESYLDLEEADRLSLSKSFYVE